MSSDDNMFFGGRPACGVSATLIEQVATNADLDRWRFAVSDGTTEGVIEAEIARAGFHALEADELELAVEDFAGRYAVEHRLPAMLAEYRLGGPFRMYVDDSGLRVVRHRTLTVV